MESMNDRYIRAKFDNEQPLTFSYSSSDEGRTDVIYFNNCIKFIAKLKTAKKLMIEAPFFSARRQDIEFDVEGLKWGKN